MTVLDFLVQLVLGVFLTATVVRRDMRRLPPERYSRSWNDASFWSAVVAFGPLSILVHFVRTRRSVGGLGLGLVWCAGTFVALTLVDEALAFVADLIFA